MMTRTATALLCAACIVLPSGCAVLNPVKVETRREMLAKIPADLPPRRTAPESILVLPPESSPVYDTIHMAYETRPYEIAYFGRTAWAERPTRMLHTLLVQTLEKARYFDTVAVPPFTGEYGHVLETKLLAFHQDFTSDPPAFRLILRVQIADRSAKEPIATRDISLREPMPERTPYAGAVAANEATAKALKEIARFVAEKSGAFRAPALATSSVVCGPRR